MEGTEIPAYEGVGRDGGMVRAAAGRLVGECCSRVRVARDCLGVECSIVQLVCLRLAAASATFYLRCGVRLQLSPAFTHITHV